MVKIKRVTNKLTDNGKIVVLTDYVALKIDNMSITYNDRKYIEKKYRCNVFDYHNGLIITFKCSGKAQCNPQDEFDSGFGKRLAGQRSWDKVKSKSYRILNDIVNRIGRNASEVTEYISKLMPL